MYFVFFIAIYCNYRVHQEMPQFYYYNRPLYTNVGKLLIFFGWGWVVWGVGGGGAHNCQKNLMQINNRVFVFI